MKPQFALIKVICIAAFASYGAAHANVGIVSLSKEEAAKRKQQQFEKSKPPAYIDQVIDEMVSEDLPPDQLPVEEKAIEEKDGLTQLNASLDWQIQEQQSGHRSQQQRFSTQVYQQTKHYGDWQIHATANRFDTSEVEQGGALDIYQSNYQIDEDWQLNSHLGFHQYAQDDLLNVTGKLSLPFASFQGISARFNEKNTALQLSHGRTAQQNSVGDIETTDDTISTVSIKHRVSSQLSVGSQLAVSRNEQGSQQAMNQVLKYQVPDEETEIKGQWLYSDSGHAVSFEGQTQIQRSKHIVGAYEIEAGTQWMGKSLAEERGAYWQRYTTHPKYNSGTELSWSEQANNEQIRAAYSVGKAINRSTRASVSGSYQHQQSQDQKTDTIKLSTSVSKQWQNNSSSQLRVSLSQREHQKHTGDEYDWEQSINYSQQWLLAHNQTVAAQFDMTRTKQQSGTPLKIGASWSKQLEKGNLTAALSQTLLLDDESQPDDLNFRVAASYDISDEWAFDASLQRDLESDQRDTTLKLSLNYRDSWGKAYSSQSRRSGSVRIVVFFDENKDGVQQPLEKTARQVAVKVGRLPVNTTNQNGELKFEQLSTGKHSIQLLSESIPLPWEKAATNPTSIDVKLRQNHTIFLALVRVDDE